MQKAINKIEILERSISFHIILFMTVFFFFSTNSYKFHKKETNNCVGKVKAKYKIPFQSIIMH